jgi:hypothetical protein
LAQHHFEIEPELELVVFFDVDPEDTITLLEVTESTPASGSVDAFVFARTNDVPYNTRIAEVTPEEYENLCREPSRLPPAWDLTKAKTFRREA